MDLFPGGGGGRICEGEGSEHGLPQERRRAWLVAVHCGRSGIDPKEAAQALRRDRKPGVDAIGMELLDHSDPAVVAAATAKA